MTYQTHDEIREDYIEKLGPEFGAAFHLLTNDYWWLQIKWSEYVELFGTSSERIDLANQAGGRFFRVVQDELWNSILLHLCRLTDKPKSRGYRRLSLQVLTEHCRDRLDVHKLRELRKLLQQARRTTRFARDWRDRHIAHRDYQLALWTAHALEGASRADVKTAIRAAYEVLNFVSVELVRVAVWDEAPAPSGPTAASLLYVIRDGLERRDEQLGRIKSGTFKQSDIYPSPL